jgi:predicted RNase H-like nuclease (RuvC/YqgF family)
MPSDEKRKINVWVPESLWKQVETLGYDSPTKATIAAFKVLVLQEEQGNNQEVLGSSQEVVGNSHKEKLSELENQFEEMQREIEAYEEKLRTAPSPLEFAHLRTKSEELEKHNDTLIRELETAERDKEDLKTTYNNYFLQIQTLINQKVIEAPGAKKPWWRFW